MPMVLSQASFSLSYNRLPKSAIRAREPPEMNCPNGLNGLKAPGGAPTSAAVGVFGGSAPAAMGVWGGMKIANEPGNSKEPVAGGASSSCDFTSA